MTQISTDKPRTAIFPGTFDPFTRGHADIVERGLRMFDRICIAIGINRSKPGAAERAEGRAEAIRNLYADRPEVGVCVYSSLTVDLARELGADFVLRGIRSTRDFEYERDMADINFQLSGLESVILFSRPELAAISSSVVRELESFGHDITAFLPSKRTL